MKALKVALAALALTSVLQHQALAEGVALGLGIGSLGPSAQVVFQLEEKWNLRAGASGYRLSYDYRESRVDYDATARRANIPVIVDWFPVPSLPQFRVSGGLFGNHAKFDVEARPDSGVYVVGNNTYSAPEVGRVNGSAKYRRIAPYVGVGWGNAVAAGKNWSWNVDVGFLYQGRPKTSYSVTCGAISAARCTQLQNDAVIEANEFDRDLRNDRTYPVVQFWMGKQF